MSNMLGQYYIIKIKENNRVIVYEVDNEKYFDHNFNYVYHTLKGETYPLYKDSNLGTDEIFVDGEHLDELLKDLNAQGFCDFTDAELNFLDYYYKTVYNGYPLAF